MISRGLASSVLAAVLGIAGCSATSSPPAVATPTPIPNETDHGSHGTLPTGATPMPDQFDGELEWVANLPKDDHSDDFYNSDLAFWGDVAAQGSYDGFRLIDIRQRDSPRLISDVDCRGPQGDVSIWDGLLFVSVDRPQTGPDCDSRDAGDAIPGEIDEGGAWEGIRIFDISVPEEPVLVTSVATDCGAHTNTLVPDAPNGRVLLYVQSSALVQDDVAPACVNPHEHISIVEVPLDDPSAASVLSQPALPDTPAWELPPGALPPGAPQRLHPSVGCHDISVFLPLKLAAAACMSEGQIWDISDPAHPVTLAHVDRPELVFWHSATWSNDGKVVAFGDENIAPQGCSDTPAGAIWFYRVENPTDPSPIGRFSLERTQGDAICSAHQFNVIPGIDRDLMVAAFYAGGASVIDFGDPTTPVEIAYHDVGGRQPGDLWAAYWYRGQVYGSDHNRGLDVFTLNLPDVAGATRLARLNPSTQE